MVQINFALREVNCKVVYYGPGLSGKTTNLEIVHQKAPQANKGELTSIATEGDRTLFFDFMPLDLGTIAGMRTRFQLYTVPGQVYYNSTRKLVLQGVDGIVFVADSQAEKMDENLESLENLKQNLAEYGKDIRDIALILQYNKRDMPTALPVADLDAKLNPWGAPTFEAVAITGEGVFPTLKALSGMVLETLNREDRAGSPSSSGGSPPPAAPAAPPAAAPPAAAGPAQGGANIDRGFNMGGGTPGATPAAPAAPAAGSASGSGRFGGGGSTFGEMQAPSGGGTAGAGAASSSSSGRGISSSSGGWTPPARKSGGPPGGGGGSASPPAKGGGGGGGAVRQVNIREDKEFPWVLVGLGVLIAGAIAFVVMSTGLIK